MTNGFIAPHQQTVHAQEQALAADSAVAALKGGRPLNIVILGLSITSSWGNGHATTYRALVRALDRRGHNVLFLERDVPWYANQRDLPDPPYGRTALYTDLTDLQQRFAPAVCDADLVIVGSYVPEGIAVGEWVTVAASGISAFYDIDTPVTLAQLAQNASAYISRELIPWYDLYLSFAGGPVLEQLENMYGAPVARPLYCAVDPELYYPLSTAAAEGEQPAAAQSGQPQWDLGYMGTYSADRQPGLERLLLAPAQACAQRFVVAGPNYPSDIRWPPNVTRIDHLPPPEHNAFYNQQRFTLNLTRAEMQRAGYSPSVRLFEAAACGTPLISDYWCGLESLFAIGEEILVAHTDTDILQYLHDLPDEERQQIGLRARNKVLAQHTAEERAKELEGYIAELW
jgi:spore maturation protein CgeB